MLSSRLHRLTCAEVPSLRASDRTRLIKAATLSKIAYSEPGNMTPQDASDYPMSYEGCKPFSSQHSHAHVWKYDDTREVYIAFRGSTTHHDLRQAMNCNKTCMTLPNHSKFTDLYVHAGHANAFASLQPILEDDIMKKVERGIEKLTLVGHSKGCALSIIAAMYFGSLLRAISPHTRVECIGFGGSRCVGGRDFVSALEECVSDHLHVINEDDLVPLLPPQPFGFRHVPRSVWMSGGRLYAQSDDNPDQQIVEHSKIASWFVTRQLKMLDDHAIDAYIHNLQNLSE